MSQKSKDPQNLRHVRIPSLNAFNTIVIHHVNDRYTLTFIDKQIKYLQLNLMFLNDSELYQSSPVFEEFLENAGIKYFIKSLSHGRF